MTRHQLLRLPAFRPQVETAFGPAQALLERTKLGALCKAGQKIVLLEHNQTVGEALKSLAKNEILSAPMVGGCSLLI